MAENNENMIEFLRGQKTCTVSFTSQKYINKIKKLYERMPECFERFKENEDGSIYARIPLKFIKISAPRANTLTEEQRQAAAERLAKSRKSKEVNDDTDESKDFDDED